MPVEGIISGVYGSQRILNGKPKWPHYGIDIAAKQGTMIKSSGSGIVTMACLLYTSPSPRDYTRSRMPSSA